MEESKLDLPADANLRKVAPGNHSGTYLTGWGESGADRQRRQFINLRNGRMSTIHFPGVRPRFTASMASSARRSIG